MFIIWVMFFGVIAENSKFVKEEQYIHYQGISTTMFINRFFNIGMIYTYGKLSSFCLISCKAKYIFFMPTLNYPVK